MELSSSFTGKGVTTKLDNTGSQEAQQGLAKIIKDAEELKFKVYQKNKDEFTKNSRIDPVFILSKSKREYIMGLIDDFNKKWGKRAQETKYNLSHQDLMDMETDKSLIKSEQDNQTAMQKAYETEHELVQRYPDKFDDAKHYQKFLDYGRTGYFDPSIPWRSQSVSEELAKLQGKLPPYTQHNATPNMPGFISTDVTYGKKEDVAPQIVDLVFRNPQHMQDMLEKWQALPQTEKDKYLDVDKSGTVSEQERSAGKMPTKDIKNPILQFYIDREYQSAIKTEPDKNPQRLATGKSSTIQTQATKIGVGSFAGNRTYGQETYTGYSFPADKIQYNIPTKNGNGLNDDGKNAISSGNVSGRLLFYDNLKNVFILQTVGSTNNPDMSGGGLVEIPAENLPNVNDITVKTSDGIDLTIGDLREAQRKRIGRPIAPTQNTFELDNL